jgi:hypothetical protein
VTLGRPGAGQAIFPRVRAPLVLVALIACRSSAPSPPAEPLANRPLADHVPAAPADLVEEVEYQRVEEPAPPPPVAPELTGAWRSACLPGVDAGTSLQLTIAGTATSLTLTVDAFTDAGCLRHEAALRTHGPFAVGAATGDGAWETTWTFAQRTLVVDDAAAARRYARLCAIPRGKLRPGKPADLLAVGCRGLGVYPVARCPGDHDRVAIVVGELQFGVRPPTNDLCTPAARPTQLDAGRAFQLYVPPTGVPACDAYLRALQRMAQCSSLPDDARAALRNGLHAASSSFLAMTQAQVVPAQVAATCQQAEQAMLQTLASLPCP